MAVFGDTRFSFRIGLPTALWQGLSGLILEPYTGVYSRGIKASANLFAPNSNNSIRVSAKELFAV
jgi:hypothetical protein